MRIFITGIILAANLVLQSTLFQHIQIRGIMPNTAIIIIVSFALLRGSLEGAIVGFCSGLLQDIFFGLSLGYFALLGMLTGYFCGKGHQDFYRENYLLPFIMCTLADFLYELIIYLTSFLFRGQLNMLHFLKTILLPEMVYTTVCSIVIYRILFSINDYLELKEKYKHRLF